MQRYRNLSGHSGVSAYALLPDAIDVAFAGGAVYRYDHANTGQAQVERMKQLAKAGRGLSTFISQHVGNRYASKLR